MLAATSHFSRVLKAASSELVPKQENIRSVCNVCLKLNPVTVLIKDDSHCDKLLPFENHSTEISVPFVFSLLCFIHGYGGQRSQNSLLNISFTSFDNVQEI